MSSSSSVSPLKINANDYAVEQFSHIVGDRSALHTDLKYAESTMFRSRLVHGMLPVCAAGSYLIGSCKEFSGASISRVSARFIKPIFVNSRLEVSFEMEEDHLPSERELMHLIEVGFVIKNEATGVIVTTGRFWLTQLESNTSEEVLVDDFKSNLESTFLLGEGAESQLEFVDVKKGLTSKIHFKICAESKCAIVRLFASLINNSIPVNVNIDILILCSLYSTFVGMRIPGRKATFLEFEINLDHRLALDQEFELLGKVGFVSATARSVLIKMSLGTVGMKEESSVDLGKLTARFEKEAIKMPSIHGLASKSVDMSNKVVLVTGGTRGIGETISKVFAVNGATVVMLFRNDEKSAARVTQEISDFGCIGRAFQCDVSNQASVKITLNQILNEFGSIDIVVNSAVSSFFAEPFLATSWSSYEELLSVIVRGSFNVTQAVLPGMIKKRWGRIINIGTIYTKSAPINQAPYIVAKSALEGLTKSVAAECAQHNILVNQIIPSVIETDLNKGMSSIDLANEVLRSPLKRLALSTDVANAALYLSSSLSNYTTGQAIYVTGGQLPLL